MVLVTPTVLDQLYLQVTYLTSKSDYPPSKPLLCARISSALRLARY
jgi:hypothetical protein